MKPTPQPPKWALRLLHWLHPTDTLEEVEGDLAELYAYWYEQRPAYSQFPDYQSGFDESGKDFTKRVNHEIHSSSSAIY